MIDIIRDYITFFSRLTPWDFLAFFIDITLVSYVIYRIILLIKGTKTPQMLLGLFLIMIGFFVSKEDILDLPTLNWLLDKFISAFLILIIVLFQDDIRRGLSRIGFKGMLGQSRGTEKEFVEELIKASTELSKYRIGGIIAIEREANLEEFVNNGIRLEANLSKEILYSIFLPKHTNPIHDGAVIIRRDKETDLWKIVKAGCVLPLSENMNLAVELGTRHRAAIGLSEITDAVVMVISEETGAISIALDGILYRSLDNEAIQQHLFFLFIKEESIRNKKSFFKGLYRKKTAAKKA